METLIDWDELETSLAETGNTKKMWISIFSLLGIMSISIFTTTVDFDSTKFIEGVFGSGWSFDYNNFFVLMLSISSAVVVLGLKIQAGMSKVVAKNKIINRKNEILKALTDEDKRKSIEIAILKRQLNDKCETLDANSDALNAVDELIKES